MRKQCISKDLELVETSYGVFYAFRNDLITRHLKTFGAHQRNELAMLMSFVREGDTVIDVGANIGTFCVPMSKKVGECGCVYAFEADKDTYKALERNINANSCDNVFSMNAIVTNQKGKFQTNVVEGNRGATFFKLDRIGEDSEQNTISLRDFFDCYVKEQITPNIIKIDVEGMELDVLKNCSDLIEAYRPIVYCEINTNTLKRYNVSIIEIDEMLKNMGYHFFRNIYKRNSDNDFFSIGRISSLKIGGDFYDLLAVHPSSDRYPESVKNSVYMYAFYIKNLLYYTFIARIVKKLNKWVNI